MILAINALRMRGSLKDKDAVNVLLKTRKNLNVHIGCAENIVIMHVGFSFSCLNMACGNLDTQLRGMHALKRKGVELLPCLKKKNS